jgi:carboxyl-terminal processing protease
MVLHHHGVRRPTTSSMIAFVLGVVSAVAVFANWPQAEAGRRTLDRKMFKGAVDTALDRHVDASVEPELLGRALKHLIAGLDDYSHYLTAAEREEARKKHRAGGATGMTVAVRHGKGGSRTIEIVAVEPGSPAARAGIVAGEALSQIGVRPSSSILSTPDATLLLLGRPGETVELVVRTATAGSARTVPLALEKLSAKRLVSSRLLDHDGQRVALVTIAAFRAGVGERVKRSLESLRGEAGAKGLAGIIVDLRSNPGGSVDEALVVADLFVATGVLTRTRGRGGRILREEPAHPRGSDLGTPIAVLVDRRSASASELLGAALQDPGRALVMGETTFGKGTVQEVIGLPDGGRLTVTVARYFSPSDRAIDGRGLTPDVVFEPGPGMDGVKRACTELLGRR